MNNKIYPCINYKYLIINFMLIFFNSISTKQLIRFSSSRIADFRASDRLSIEKHGKKADVLVIPVDREVFYCEQKNDFHL